MDHVLHLMKTFYNNQQIIKYCNVNESEFFHSYLIAYRYHLTYYIPYHVAEYPLYEWINILMTFSWNFIDLFIILISVALAMRFNQINCRLIENRSVADRCEHFWSQIRQDYYSMVNLVEKVDEEISMLILISTGHNMFSLCVVIFQSLTRWKKLLSRQSFLMTLKTFLYPQKFRRFNSRPPSILLRIFLFDFSIVICFIVCRFGQWLS